MTTIIILIGTELLSGATLDTNSIYMAKELNKVGIKITYKLTVGDKIEDIIEALKFAKDRAQLIILSGGLGPTDDDLTKKALSKFLGRKLIVDAEELEEAKNKFKKLDLEFLDKNLKEIEKPKGAYSIKNDVGIAPAFYVDDIAVFPGVPSELKNMFPKFLDYYIKQSGKEIDPIYIKDFLINGIPESIIEEKVKEFFTYDGIEYEFLLKNNGVLLRLQTTEKNKKIVEKIREKIYNRLGNHIISEDDENILEKLYNLMEKENMTLSVVESCTGGLLSSKIVSIEGISKYYKEGIVTYSNSSKLLRAGVKEESLTRYSAVSSEVAKEMLSNIDTDLGIAITGYASLSAELNEDMVGVVYIATKVGDKLNCERYKFLGDRDTIREKAVYQSLFNLCRKMEEVFRSEHRRED